MPEHWCQHVVYIRWLGSGDARTSFAILANWRHLDDAAELTPAVDDQVAGAARRLAIRVRAVDRRFRPGGLSSHDDGPVINEINTCRITTILMPAEGRPAVSTIRPLLAMIETVLACGVGPHLARAVPTRRARR